MPYHDLDISSCHRAAAPTGDLRGVGVWTRCGSVGVRLETSPPGTRHRHPLPSAVFDLSDSEVQHRGNSVAGRRGPEHLGQLRGLVVNRLASAVTAPIGLHVRSDTSKRPIPDGAVSTRVEAVVISDEKKGWGPE